MADELERAANSVAGVWLDPYEAAEAIVDRDTAKAETDRLRRNLAITSQALSEARAELAHCRPVADAAHAYCAAWYGPETPQYRTARDALLAAHRATTPSKVPSSHVIVERAELERLQAIERRAAEYVSNHPCEGNPDEDVCSDESDLRGALDGA